MKKLLVITVMIILFAGEKVFSQFTEIKAGVNFATIHFYDDQDVMSDGLKRKPGYHISVLHNFSLGDNFAIKTGGQLVLKGMKSESSESYSGPDYSYSYSYKSVLNLTYLEVPVLVTYTTSLGSKMTGYLSTGPYLGIGILGKGKSESIYNGEKSTNEFTVEWGNTDEDDLKRTDLGFQFGLGLEYKALFFETSYHMGLNNIIAYDWGDFKMSNRDIRIGIGYRFSE